MAIRERTNPDRWAELERVFHKALDTPIDLRAAFVREACGPDIDLRIKVERLLAAEDESRAFTHRLAEQRRSVLNRLQSCHAVSEQPGDLIGPYRLERKLGAGGMGTVWLAGRHDGQFQKQVAIKLIKRGMDSEEIVRRFRRERNVLAALEHPGIARLYDGGVAEDGRPYLVMEYVEGVPINRFCVDKHLVIPDRLGLFLRVCDAVQYAHARLVVHRDLKPLNILVTADGEVKLLDFGVAKVLGPDAPDRMTTAEDLRLMTPRYASPEQLLGGQITTATDIYSLGVVLFELLTGRQPHPISPGAGFDEVKHIVCESPPPRPSAIARAADSRMDGAESHRVARLLSGDLDRIALQALHRDPQRRYVSVEALAEDVRSYLEHRPISARPDSWAYRAGKLVRRNRVASAAIMLTFAAMATAAGVSYRMYQEAAHARRAEARQRQTAEQINRFLVGMLSAPNPLGHGHGNKDVRVADVLDRASHSLGETIDNRAVELELRRTIGNTNRALGRHEVALAELQAAIALSLELNGERHESSAQCFYDFCALAYDAGRLEEAESACRKSLEIRRALHGSHHELTAASAYLLAMALAQTARYAEAVELLEAALHVVETRFGPGHPRVSEVLNVLGALYTQQGDFARAEPILHKCLATHRVSPGSGHPNTAVMMQNLGGVLERLGRSSEAEPLYLEALDVFRRALGDEHRMTFTARFNYASFLEKDDRLAEAETAFRDLITDLQTAFGEDDHDLADARMALGHTLNRLGQFDEAESLLRTALPRIKSRFGNQHPQVAIAAGGLATAILGQSDPADFPEVERLYLDSLSTLEATLGPTHPFVQESLRGLARLYGPNAWNRPAKLTAIRVAPTHSGP